MMEHPGLQEMYMESRIAELRADCGRHPAGQPSSPRGHGVGYAFTLPVRTLAALWRKHGTDDTPVGTPPATEVEPSSAVTGTRLPQ